MTSPARRSASTHRALSRRSAGRASRALAAAARMLSGRRPRDLSAPPQRCDANGVMRPSRHDDAAVDPGDCLAPPARPVRAVRTCARPRSSAMRRRTSSDAAPIRMSCHVEHGATLSEHAPGPSSASWPQRISSSTAVAWPAVRQTGEDSLARSTCTCRSARPAASSWPRRP